MQERISLGEAHARLEEYLKQRRDIGLRKAIANMILEPPNPFDPEARRKPKAGFVVATILFVAVAVSFVYFNIAP